MKLKKIYQFLLQKEWGKLPPEFRIFMFHFYLPIGGEVRTEISKDCISHTILFEKEILKEIRPVCFKYNKLDKFVLIDKKSILINLFFLDSTFFHSVLSKICLSKEYTLEITLEIKAQKYTYDIISHALKAFKTFNFPNSDVFSNFAYFFMIYLLVLILIKEQK